MGISTFDQSCALAEVRSATAAKHRSLDELIDPSRVVERDYYAAVMAGLIQAAEVIECELSNIPTILRRERLSRDCVSKRQAIDAENSFLENLGTRPVVPSLEPAERRPIITRASARPAALGILYVYIGSALGGTHLLRMAQAAPWWDGERQHLLLRPYGRHFAPRWQTLLRAVARLEVHDMPAAVAAAHAAFDAHTRSLAQSLSTVGQ